jgi:Zn-dependent membrane protease YugP
MFYFDPLYLLIFVVTIAITGWAAWNVRSTFAKWDRVPSGIPADAFGFARALLDTQGLQHVRVEPTEGHLTDHYDPRGRVLRVSSTVAGGAVAGGGARRARPEFGVASVGGRPGAAVGLSVASAAVIAHEVGHALQHQEGSVAMKIRQAIVPLAQLGSGLGPFLILFGLIFQLTGLAVLGLVFFAAAVAFTFATLPVEIGASNRALRFVDGLGMSGERLTGARAVLRAAAWTYVASALTALLNFLYYLTLVSRSR